MWSTAFTQDRSSFSIQIHYMQTNKNSYYSHRLNSFFLNWGTNPCVIFSLDVEGWTFSTVIAAERDFLLWTGPPESSFQHRSFCHMALFKNKEESLNYTVKWLKIFYGLKTEQPMWFWSFAQDKSCFTAGIIPGELETRGWAGYF